MLKIGDGKAGNETIENDLIIMFISKVKFYGKIGNDDIFSIKGVECYSVATGECRKDLAKSYTQLLSSGFIFSFTRNLSHRTRNLNSKKKWLHPSYTWNQG